MNKLQLTEELGVRMGYNAHEAERVVNTFIHLIYEQLAAGQVVNISGFGKFSVSHRLARLGVNPQNPSVKITIPELNTPKFKAGEAFKAAVKLRK